MLEAQEAEDTKYGTLVAIHRQLYRNMKIGVDYNFTDFSDDLTDLDYNNDGLFFNAVGKF